MRNLTLSAWALALFVCVGPIDAQETAVTHVFEDGTPAKAEEINQNFQDLATAIDAASLGPVGPAGAPGVDGTSCSVSQEVGGARITCTDGSEAFIENSTDNPPNVSVSDLVYSTEYGLYYGTVTVSDTEEIFRVEIKPELMQAYPDLTLLAENLGEGAAIDSLSNGLLREFWPAPGTQTVQFDALFYKQPGGSGLVVAQDTAGNVARAAVEVPEFRGVFKPGIYQLDPPIEYSPPATACYSAFPNGVSEYPNYNPDPGFIRILSEWVGPPEPVLVAITPYESFVDGSLQGFLGQGQRLEGFYCGGPGRSEMSANETIIDCLAESRSGSYVHQRTIGSFTGRLNVLYQSTSDTTFDLIHNYECLSPEGVEAYTTSTTATWIASPQY